MTRAPRSAHSSARGGTAAVVTIDEVRAFALELPRAYEAVVRGRVKFRVGRIVFVAFSRDETLMGFGFPKEFREAAIEAEPEKFVHARRFRPPLQVARRPARGDRRGRDAGARARRVGDVRAEGRRGRVRRSSIHLRPSRRHVADVFISYSRHDSEFVRELHAFLTAAGRDVWVDWEDIPPASEWEQDIDNSIDEAESVVYVVSTSSLASKYCGLELAARAEGRQADRADRLRRRPTRRRRLAGAAAAELDLVPATATTARRRSRSSRARSTPTSSGRGRTRGCSSARSSGRRTRTTACSSAVASSRRPSGLLTANAADEPTPTELQQRYVRASRGRCVVAPAPAARGRVAAARRSRSRSPSYAFLQRDSARTERDTATSVVIGLAADNLTTDDFDVALAARGSTPTGRARPCRRGARMISALETVRSSGVRTILRTHQGRVHGVAFSPDGSMLALGGRRRDGGALDTGLDERASASRSTVAKRSCWTSRSRRRSTLASAAAKRRDGAACGTSQRRASRASGCPVVRGTTHGVAFAPDGHTVASAGDDGTVLLRTRARPGDSGALARRRRGAGLGSRTSRPTGTRSPPRASDGTVLVWDTQGSAEPERLGGRQGARARRRLQPGREHARLRRRRRDGRALERARAGRGPAGASTGARARCTASRSARTDACSPRRARGHGPLGRALRRSHPAAGRPPGACLRRRVQPGRQHPRLGRRGRDGGALGPHAPASGLTRSLDGGPGRGARRGDQPGRRARSPRRATTEPSCCRDAQRTRRGATPDRTRGPRPRGRVQP